MGPLGKHDTTPNGAGGPPLLTVAIPTFDRAPLLDALLGWFADAVVGLESSVELLVSDNCSTDETPQVTERWQRAMADMGVEARFTRNDRNVGAIRNIASCFERARTPFVWTIGDDDAVDPDALRSVLDKLDAHPDLTLLILNFSSRHWKTGEQHFERCYEVDADEVATNGQALFERFLGDPHPSRWGGLALTSALVYRTETAQAALRSWPEGVDNITLQLYVTAWCARAGKTILTRDVHVEMAAGRHFFAKDKMLFFRFRIADVPESFVKIAELGYSRELCRAKIRHQRNEIAWRRVLHLFSRQPLATVQVLARYVSAGRAVRST